MKSLFELRKEAQTLGIEDYSSMSKETLAQAIEDAKVGGTTTYVSEEELSPEDAAIIEAAEKEDAKEEEDLAKMSPVEKLAARNAKIAAQKAAKEEAKLSGKQSAKEKREIEKAEKARLKEDAKILKAAEKEAAKAEKEAAKAEKEAAKAEKEAARTDGPRTPRIPTNLANFLPKGEKPAFRTGMSGEIYDEILKNDGRSYGDIARAIGTHYNMVRRVAEMYFDVSVAAAPMESQSFAPEISHATFEPQAEGSELTAE